VTANFGGRGHFFSGSHKRTPVRPPTVRPSSVYPRQDQRNDAPDLAFSRLSVSFLEILYSSQDIK